MKCKNAGRLLNRYADGECADPVEMSGIEEHLAICSVCCARLDEIQALRRILIRAGGTVTASAPTAEIIRKYREGKRRALWPGRPFGPVPFAAAAAAVVLLIGSIGIINENGDASLGQYLLGSMSETEVVYLAVGEGVYPHEFYVR
ncbi:MAG TPA: zf-HC2 domain-containing protein [Spirochaetota bacterium]|nr:zf-HC2 domain-containing protein [Spirochaetota bacterium]